MEFTFSIQNLKLRKVATQKIIADNVSTAWVKMRTLINPEEEATLVYIGSTRVGEPLQEFLNQ